MRVFYTNCITVLRTVILLAVLLISNSAKAETPFAAGAGTVDDPYQITTVDQLKAINQNPSESLSKHYKLMEDLALTGAWTPIGTYPYYFTGTLDGDGHTISNLEIDNNIIDGSFICNNEGTIKNLGLELGENGIKSIGAVGGLVANNIEEGQILNCYVKGKSISGKLTKRSSYVGGICGYNKGTIENCFVQVDTIATNNETEYPFIVGGITGYQNGGTIKHSISFVEAIKHLDKDGNPTPGDIDYIAGDQYGNCTSIGNYVSYKTKIMNPGAYLKNTPSDRGTLWLGTLSNEHTAWSYANNTLTLTTTDKSKSFSFDNLEAHTYLNGEGTATNPFKINDETDLRTFSDYTNNSSYPDTFNYVLTADIDLENRPFTPIASRYTVNRGGIIYCQSFSGHFDGQKHSIKNLTVNSSSGLFALIQNATIQNVALIDCQINSCAYTNSGYKMYDYAPWTVVGTLVGGDYGSANNEGESVISNCYATGTIQVDALAGKNYSVGGIIGQLKYTSEVSSCFSDVKITMNKPVDGGTGSVEIGGIVGVLGGTVQNCFAKGSIRSTTKTKDTWNSVYIGSIVGRLDYSDSGLSFGKMYSSIALSANIESTIDNGVAYRHIVSRIGTRKCEKTYLKYASYQNYGRQKVNLKLNGAVFPSIEDQIEFDSIQKLTGSPIVHFAEDGTNWNGELPSNQWERTDDGYVNLKSISQTFGLKEQIKLSDYTPLGITVDKKITHGTIACKPVDKAFAGDTVKLTITPDANYMLKPNSLKATGAITDTIKVNMADSSFVMTAQAVTLSAEFIPDSLRLASITAGDSLLILEKGTNWFYLIKKETKTKSLSLDTEIPFNGIISGTLAAGTVISFEPSCKGALTFDAVTVTNLVIKSGASVVLSETSKLIYTEVKNDGGALVARNGATIVNTSSGEVKMNKLTINTPQNGTLAVNVGNISISSGDMLAVDTKFSVTAAPASGYQTESLSVKTAAGGELPATDNLYTMPDAVVTISATFKSTYVPPVPVPTFYTITLPKVKGVVTNPQAGEYSREEGSNFSFTLTLEADYKQSHPVVTANGTVLTPRASDGKYVIYAISADTRIEIEGIYDPTSNAEVESGTKVWTGKGCLIIHTEQPRELLVLTFSGKTVYRSKANEGENRITGLTNGAYIVKLEGEESKTVVVH